MHSLTLSLDRQDTHNNQTERQEEWQVKLWTWIWTFWFWTHFMLGSEEGFLYPKGIKVSSISEEKSQNWGKVRKNNLILCARNTFSFLFLLLSCDPSDLCWDLLRVPDPRAGKHCSTLNMIQTYIPLISPMWNLFSLHLPILFVLNWKIIPKLTIHLLFKTDPQYFIPRGHWFLQCLHSFYTSGYFALDSPSNTRWFWNAVCWTRTLSSYYKDHIVVLSGYHTQTGKLTA